jgi:thiaminase/transcriptional activator TenA
METTFTNQLWKLIKPVYQHILAHPFIAELTHGTLPREVFAFYMAQDALYLEDFARALAHLATKAPDAEAMLQLIRFTEGAVVVEKALHGHYFEVYGVKEMPEKAPGCFTYTHYLCSVTALEPYAVGMAAVLPCFWIYREVGKHIYAHAPMQHPYRAWIDTYSGEDFDRSVQAAIQLTNQAAAAASTTERQGMEKAFYKASQLEWLFWDSAYRREGWLP